MCEFMSDGQENTRMQMQKMKFHAQCHAQQAGMTCCQPMTFCQRSVTNKNLNFEACESWRETAGEFSLSPFDSLWRTDTLSVSLDSLCVDREVSLLLWTLSAWIERFLSLSQGLFLSQKDGTGIVSA